MTVVSEAIRHQRLSRTLRIASLRRASSSDADAWQGAIGRMTLILTVKNGDALEESAEGRFVADADSAVAGRSRNCDWHLPDAGNVVSSRHFELRREGDAWFIVDISTNGTYLNGAVDRLAGEHRIAAGDVLRVGPYDIEASFGKAEASPTPEVAAAPQPEPEPAPAMEPAPAEPAPVAVEPVSPPEPEPVAEAAPPPPEPAPPATDPAPEPAAFAANEPALDHADENRTMMWDSIADMNKVDWERGGFGAKDAVVTADASTVDGIVQQLIEAAALTEVEVQRSPELIAKAGSLLKRLVSGLLVMVEARARAKAQMGAELTGLQLEGNNPIKFARTPEQALAQLLNPPESGFMEADRAVEDAYIDLQSHQVATLKAIPGALRATLDRFSPGAVRRRATSLGFMAKIIPAFRDAALWRAYERDYVAVKKESDEAFMEVFAKEFRKAYERQLRDGLN